jgi:hypothetical protein
MVNLRAKSGARLPGCSRSSVSARPSTSGRPTRPSRRGRPGQGGLRRLTEDQVALAGRRLRAGVGDRHRPQRRPRRRRDGRELIRETVGDGGDAADVGADPLRRVGQRRQHQGLHGQAPHRRGAGRAERRSTPTASPPSSGTGYEHPDPAPPRREHLEPGEPVHRLDRRRPHRAKGGGGQGGGTSDGRGRAAAPTSSTPRCCCRAIRPPTWPWRRWGWPWLPVTRHWRLNERHYGALQGLNKAETAEKHGDEQVLIWRRSYDIPPPALESDDERHPRHDPRYAMLAPPSSCPPPNV